MLDENGNEIFQETSIADYIEFGYTEFGRHVNRHRHIPFSLDGVKPVYRHVVQVAYELPDKMTKAVAIIGDALKKYHFTGDASVAPIVSELVNIGMFEGQGNHGNYVLLGPDDPASAPRYVEAMLSPVIRKQLDKISPYVETEKSATGFDEWLYLPTPIPITLAVGSLGIGLGIGARIPAFTMRSLYDAYVNNDPTRLEINYGYELDPESFQGIIDLWETGRGQLTIRIPIKEEYIDGEFGYVISCTPRIFKPAWGKIKEWESLGWLSIDDISDVQPKIFIHRVKRVRAITDEDIYNELYNDACVARKTYTCTIYDGRITGIIGMRDWISISYNNYKRLYARYISDNLAKLDYDLVTWRDFRRVAELILENKDGKEHSYEEIVDIVNAENLKGKRDAFRESYQPLTLDHVTTIGRKSINTLRHTDPEEMIKLTNKEIDRFNKLDVESEIRDYVNTWSVHDSFLQDIKVNGRKQSHRNRDE